MSRFLLCLTLFIVLSSYELGEVECENKYSKKANEPKEETQSKNVFRIQQINLVWEKAQKASCFVLQWFGLLECKFSSLLHLEIGQSKAEESLQ